MQMMTRIIVLAAASVSAVFAQRWEFGGMGGGGFLNSVGVTAPSGTATAGFSNSAAFGGYVGYNSYKNLGGEIHYDYLPTKLRLASGGSEATFNGNSHAIHYDVVFHTNRQGSKVQFFATAGGGVKIFRGTGTEHAVQPLSAYGYFTKTQEFKPMGTVSAGVKFQLAPHIFLRTEIRDFITPFPKQVITPPAGVKYGSILNELVPMVGITIDM
jgi:hypothetical protein